MACVFETGIINSFSKRLSEDTVADMERVLQIERRVHGMMSVFHEQIVATRFLRQSKPRSTSPQVSAMDTLIELQRHGMPALPWTVARAGCA